MSYYYEEWEYDQWEIPDEQWEYAEEQAVPEIYAGGCLPHMVIPPLAVLVISALLFFTLSNVAVASSDALTTSAAQPNADAAEAVDSSASANTQLAAFFSPAVRHWESDILSWSKEWDLDPNLVATVMQIESCGDPQARSSAGAAGLFQVMPFHFAAAEDAYDPAVNAWRGLSYLQRSLQSHNKDARLAFAGYNGGIGGSQRPESQWPAETVRYTYWGEGIYRDALEGKSQSARLDEWFSAGGASLCAQASQRLGLNQ
jgi:hypothetical protein